MGTTIQPSLSRSALICFAISMGGAVVGLITLPLIAGYFAVAVIAGGLLGGCLIIGIRKGQRSAMGIICSVLIGASQMIARDHFLPSTVSSSPAYPFVFVALAFAVGLGADLIYHEIKNRGS